MEKCITDLSKELFDYIDDDLFIISNASKMPSELLGEPLNMELLLFCKSGKATYMLEQAPMRIEAGQCALCPDYAPINDLVVSPDLTLCIVGFSWHLLEDIPALVKSAWLSAEGIMREPIFTPTPQQQQSISAYLKLIIQHVQEEHRTYRKEIIHLLCQTLVFEFMAMVSERNGDAEAGMPSAEVTQSALLTRQFFEILAQGGGRIRSVGEVAKSMNITPKYLSRVISKASGHPPLFYIRQYTLRAIERQLRYSELTIKEIAMDMGFPTLAFFGKFVREHLGVSPRQYRESIARAK